MEQEFVLPAGLIGRFAIVKLWPGIKTAEDECIARLKLTATILGLQCFEIHADGRLLEDPDKIISKSEVDFVLHLHYDTPKFYDAFSFVALWNPTQFYHEWGYARTTRNLLSHDDFVSCSSPAADDHVGRLVRSVATHLPPFFNLYHSVADVVHEPSLGDCKLFYAGINWEALGGGKSRHQELLKRLDKTGYLRIFGPTIFQGVKVWNGYASYVREIPFDGISMIDEIAKAGIALVLSSKAHKDSELMSNRLFESVAAGALVICDENNFAKKYFGDSLLYIDSRCSVEETLETIEGYFVWIKNNPEKALAMAVKAQGIFKQKFILKKNLSDLYCGLTTRKQELSKKQRPVDSTKIKVQLYLLMPEYSESVLNSHISSILAQEYKNFSAILIIDKAQTLQNRNNIENVLAKLTVPIRILEIAYFDIGINQKIKSKRKLGAVIAEAMSLPIEGDAIVLVAPNERIYSNHLEVLVGSLARNPNSNCAATAVVLSHSSRPVHGVFEKIDFRRFDQAQPIGYARFIFRVSVLPKDLNIALPYLDRKSMAILIGDNIVAQELPSTVIINIENEFPQGPWDEGQENELLSSYCPPVFSMRTGHEIILPELGTKVAPTSIESRLWIAVKIPRLSWFVEQARALRRYGLVSRLGAAKRKLGRLLA
jgi:hypothetical protein